MTLSNPTSPVSKRGARHQSPGQEAESRPLGARGPAGREGAIAFEFSLLSRGNMGEGRFVPKRCFLPLCQKKVHFIKVRKFYLFLELQIT